MAKDTGLSYKQTASDTLEHYYPSRESSLTPVVLQKTGFQHQVYRTWPREQEAFATFRWTR